MKLFLFSLLTIFSLSLGTLAEAQNLVYESIVDIPRLDPNTQSTETYVNALYWLAITVGALLAVVRIIFAGVKYMITDVVPAKGDALKDIRGALFGLLIILSAVLILNTINKDLTTLSIFGNAPALKPIPEQTNRPPIDRAEIGETLNPATASKKERQIFHASCMGRLLKKTDMWYCKPL